MKIPNIPADRDNIYCINLLSSLSSAAFAAGLFGKAMKLIKGKRIDCHQDGAGEAALCRQHLGGLGFSSSCVPVPCPSEELGLQAGTGRDEITAGT